MPYTSHMVKFKVFLCSLLHRTIWFYDFSQIMTSLSTIHALYCVYFVTCLCMLLTDERP